MVSLVCLDMSSVSVGMASHMELIATWSFIHMELRILSISLNLKVERHTDDISIPMTYPQYSLFRGR